MIVRILNIILASVVSFWLVSPVQAERAFYSAFSLVPNATALGDLVFTGTVGRIRMDTVDASDNKYVAITGGGAESTSRGAVIQIYGNENNNGTLDLQSGATASALIRFFVNNLLRWSFNSSGDLTQDASNGGDVVFNRSTFGIRAGTSDTADNIIVNLSGGGAYNLTGTRGAGIALAGDESSSNGSLTLSTGTNVNGLLIFRLNNNAQHVRFQNSLGSTMWSFQGNGVISQDGTNGGDIVLNRVTTDITRTRETVTAAGTNQGTAAAITGHFVQVNGASGTNGVILPSSSIGKTRTIFNNSASALLLYPASGGVINANATNASVSIAAYALAYVMEVGSGQYYISEAPAA